MKYFTAFCRTLVSSERFGMLHFGHTLSYFGTNLSYFEPNLSYPTLVICLMTPGIGSIFKEILSWELAKELILQRFGVSTGRVCYQGGYLA